MALGCIYIIYLQPNHHVCSAILKLAPLLYLC